MALNGRSLPARSAILLLNLFVGSLKVPTHLRSAHLRIGIAPKWRRVGLLSPLAVPFCEIVAVAFVRAAEAVVRHGFIATSRLVELQTVHSVFNFRMASQRAIALLNFIKGVQESVVYPKFIVSAAGNFDDARARRQLRAKAGRLNGRSACGE